MLKHVITTILIIALLSLSTTALGSPIGLPWGKKVDKHFKKAKGLRYIYGSVIQGEIVYRGEIDGVETEVQATFTDEYVSRVITILGPSGLSLFNCQSSYNKIVDLLNKKYGHFVFTKLRESSEIADLIHSNRCRPLMLGMREVTTYWKTKNLRITATLWGNEENIYIELEYAYVPLVDKLKQSKAKKLLNKL